MAFLITNTSTLIKFNLSLNGFGLVTFDMRGSGFDLNPNTQRFNDGVIDSLEINTFNGAFSTSAFDNADLGALNSPLQLPISSSDSIEDFMADLGADSFELDEPGTLTLFQAFSTDQTLRGSTGADSIYAGTGDDIIRAGAGDDTINAGFGENTVLGAMALISSRQAQTSSSFPIRPSMPTRSLEVEGPIPSMAASVRIPFLQGRALT